MTRAKWTRVALAAIPAAGYVVLMALIAALWVKPPLLGWIGFAIVVGVCITVAVFTASKLLIVTTGESQWLEDDLLERARHVVPSVEQVVPMPAQAPS